MTQVPPESTPWRRAGADPKPAASGEQIGSQRKSNDVAREATDSSDSKGAPSSADSAPNAAPPPFPEAHSDEGKTGEKRDDRRPG